MKGGRETHILLLDEGEGYLISHKRSADVPCEGLTGWTFWDIVLRIWIEVKVHHPHPDPLPSREREKGRDFVGGTGGLILPIS